MLGDISSAPDFSWLRKQWVTIVLGPLVIAVTHSHARTSGVFLMVQSANICIEREYVNFVCSHYFA